MKLSKKSIAYLLVACMLMSFMPVITSATETTDNYYVTDYVSGDTETLISGHQLNTEFSLAGINYTGANAYAGYLQLKGNEVLEEDPTVTTALYYKEDNTPLVIGNGGNAWTDFVHDVRIKATYNGNTVYIPIVGLGTDMHCSWVRFGVAKQGVIEGLGLAADADVASIFTKENVTDFELVGVPGSGVTKTLPITVSAIAKAGTGRGRASYDVQCASLSTTAFANAYPEYFYLGTKKTVTTAATTGIYARLADGTSVELPTSAASGLKDCEFIRDVALSGTYTAATGKAYNFEAVPFTQIRQNGGKNSSYFMINAAELLAQVQAQDSSVTSLDSDYGLKLSNFKLVARKYNTGFFPEGTIYVAPSDFGTVKLSQSNGSGAGVIGNANGSAYHGMYRNIYPLSTVFTVEEAGTYKIYTATQDIDGSRGGSFYVNGEFISAKNTHTELGIGSNYSGMTFYWRPTASTVTLNAGENIIYFPRTGNEYNAETEVATTGSNYRFHGIALVPTSETVEFDLDKAKKMSNLFDTNASTDLDILTTLADKTHGKPYFDYADVNVTVNGKAVTVAPGQIYKDAYSKESYNWTYSNAFTGTPTTLNYTRDGKMIYAPTVLDAMSAAGVDYATFGAAQVDGKTCDPARTYIKDGMEITTIATENINKTNFAPVARDLVCNQESTMPNPYGVRSIANTTNTCMLKYMPFITWASASEAAATDTNIIGCKFNGYVALNSLGAEKFGAAIPNSNFAVGDKTYFMNDDITNTIYSNEIRTDIVTQGTFGTNPTSSNPRTYVELDGKNVVNPFGFAYQKTHSNTYISGEDWYDSEGWYITNTASTNDIVANKIKAGEYQLITTGTAIFNVVVTKNGKIQRTLDEQVATCMEPYTIELNAGEQAYVWNYKPYAGDKKTAGTDMKPLCDVLTY